MPKHRLLTAFGLGTSLRRQNHTGGRAMVMEATGGQNITIPKTDRTIVIATAAVGAFSSDQSDWRGQPHRKLSRWP